jgi:hypothetical protein
MSFEIGTAANATDLLSKLNTFLTSKGKAYGLSFTGTGNGTLGAWDGGASSVSETFTITATSATQFNVVGSVSGNIGTATVDTTFTHDKLTFLIASGSTPFAVGDTFKINTCPPWVSLRNNGGTDFIINGFDNIRYVFDGSNSTVASMAKASLPGWMGLKLNAATQVMGFQWQIYYDTSMGPTNIALEYSDDGVSWTQAQAWSGISWSQAYEAKTFDLSSSAGSHMYWRAKPTTGGTGGSVHCTELHFFTATGAPAANRIEWEYEAIWSTVGNDGLRAIYVGAKNFWDAGGDYYNWRLNGFTGFNNAQPFANQPGGMNKDYTPFVPMWKNSMPYWFVANGQRVMMFVRVSTIYMSMYMGLVNTFISPGQYPYPLLIGGCMAYNSIQGVGSANLRYSITGNQIHSWWRGYPYSYNDDNLCAGRLRLPDGRFSGLQACGQDSPATNAGCTPVWPWANNGNGFANIRENLDGSYPLIPVILSADNGNPTGTYVNCYGEYDGVRATTGHGNAPENTISEGMFTNVVWQDTYRNSKEYFCAFKLD